jgi:hypothetical protein
MLFVKHMDRLNAVITRTNQGVPVHHAQGTGVMAMMVLYPGRKPARHQYNAYSKVWKRANLVAGQGALTRQGAFFCNSLSAPLINPVYLMHHPV